MQAADKRYAISYRWAVRGGFASPALRPAIASHKTSRLGSHNRMINLIATSEIRGTLKYSNDRLSGDRDFVPKIHGSPLRGQNN